MPIDRMNMKMKVPFRNFALAELEFLHQAHDFVQGPHSALNFLSHDFPSLSPDQQQAAHKEMQVKGWLDDQSESSELLPPFQDALEIAAAADQRLRVVMIDDREPREGFFYGDGTSWVLAWADSEGFHLSPVLGSSALAALLLRMDKTPRFYSDFNGDDEVKAGDTLLLSAVHQRALRVLLSLGLDWDRPVDLALAKTALGKHFTEPDALVQGLQDEDFFHLEDDLLQVSSAFAPWLAMLSQGSGMGLEMEIAFDGQIERLALDIFGAPGGRMTLSLLRYADLVEDQVPESVDPDTPLFLYEYFEDEQLAQHIEEYMLNIDDNDDDDDNFDD